MESHATKGHKSACERMMDATACFVRKLDTVPSWREARLSNFAAVIKKVIMVCDSSNIEMG
jgi:hypothetical protein